MRRKKSEQTVGQSLPNYFANNLRFLISKHKLTMDQVGAVVQLGRTVISAYQCGSLEPTVMTLRLLTRHFGYSADDLLERDIRPLTPKLHTVTDFTEGYAMASGSTGNNARAGAMLNEGGRSSPTATAGTAGESPPDLTVKVLEIMLEVERQKLTRN